MQWEIVDPEAIILPKERYRAVNGKHEYRIFYDPEEGYGEGLTWILGVREVPEAGVPQRVYYHPYRTEAEAKKAAEQWNGPPPPGE